jgi:membrane associated rhomboid family serine protease
MIPIKDNVPSRRFPLVNYTIIAVSTVVFLGQLSRDGDSLVEKYGMIPARVLSPGEPVLLRSLEPVETLFGPALRERSHEAESPPFSAWWTLLTCIFLHGGWMHFLGNMWVLYIFGDNVEDRFGRLAYLGFYLASGVAASIAHLASDPGSTVPTIGASGAIGSFFLLYPRARVLTLVPIIYFLEFIVLPAPIFLGLWFLLQFFQGTLAITSSQTGGVAWWAHVGGFLTGLLVTFVLKRQGLLQPEVSLDDERGFRRVRYRIR